MPRSIVLLAVVALIVAGCSNSSQNSTPPPAPTVFTPVPTETAIAPTATDAPVPSPTPTESPSPVPSLTPTPAATPTAGPTVTPLAPNAVLRASVDDQVAYAGLRLNFEVTDLEPLEQVELLFTSPVGVIRRAPAVRADGNGTAAWTRDSTRDVTGVWSVLITGELGSVVQLRYTLKEAELPVQTVVLGETAFQVYRTPEAVYHFDVGVRSASVLQIGEIYRQTLSFSSEALVYDPQESLDFFLLPNPQALSRELTAAGASAGAGLEAGVSLFGFPRSGIFLDMASPIDTRPHVVAHEVSHQTTARIEGPRNAPHWFEEGLADHQGFQVALGIDREQELQWRRLTRQTAKRVVEEGRWIDLDLIANQDVWFMETDFSRAELFYAEAYATVDYVASAFGEQALRPLLEALADRPEEVDAVTRQLLGMGFADFQVEVQQSLLRQDDYEREVQGVIEYARVIREILDDEVASNGLWNRYVAERQALLQEERTERVAEVVEAYRALLTRVEETAVSDLTAETQTIFLSTFSSFLQGMEGFQRFELGGGNDALNEGNTGLEQADSLMAAARDGLVALLHQLAITDSELEPRAAV